MKLVALKVGELTNRDDYGFGVARLDARLMDKIGVGVGNIIEIHGNRKTMAIADYSYPADVGLNIIRIDGLARRNADTAIGEVVKVSASKPRIAKKVVLSPAEKDIMVHISADLLRQSFLGRPLSKGDVVMPQSLRKQERKNVVKEFFDIDDMEKIFFPFGGEAKLVVADTDPKGPVLVGEKTKIEVANWDFTKASRAKPPAAITIEQNKKKIRYMLVNKKGFTRERLERALENKNRELFFSYKEKDGLWYLFKKTKK